MRNWNVVVTTYEHSYVRAWHYLETFGQLAKTDYFNVVTLQVEDIDVFLLTLHQQIKSDPELGFAIARIVPITSTFRFQTAQEFEEAAKVAVTPWVKTLADTRFHVRMHRRGFKGRISSQDEEHFLDHYLQQKLLDLNTSATITFNDPDFIIAIETIGQQGGASLWSRDELLRFPLVKLD